jgi:hypothetical protein
MRVPLAAPLRVGAWSDCSIAASDGRHRHDWLIAQSLAGRASAAPHPVISTLRIASEIGAIASPKESFHQAFLNSDTVNFTKPHASA